MALTVTPQANPLVNKLVVQTSATSTGDVNVTGAAGTFYMVEIDNTANSAITYVKLYDTATLVVGTTQPNWIFGVPASVKKTFAVPDGIVFATALSMCAVQEAGTPGTTNPTSAVIVRILSS